MPNWAIVIGINEYWKEEFHLKGAVRDALKMMNWLADSAGGNVAAKNLFLMTRPAPTEPVPLGVERFDATRSLLTQVVKRLMQRSGGRGDRFFFYFSGHGLINRQDFSDEQALVMADFDDTLTDNAVGFRSIYEYFQASQLREQFYIVDACRNILKWEGEFRISELPLVASPIPTNLTVKQARLFATSPRLRTSEIQDAPGQERGAFTEVLLEGLKGTGKAKQYDSPSDEYVVRVGRLFKYVEAEVLKKKINVSEDPTQPLYQQPESEYKAGAEDLELARFSLDEVLLERLDVIVSPESVWPQAEVHILSETGETDKTVKPITGKPVTLPSLSPMIYTVRASAPDHEAEKKKWSFELYEPYQLEVLLLPKPGGTIIDTPGAGGAAATGGSTRGEFTRAEPAATVMPTSATMKDLAIGQEPGDLIVEATDTLAALEVLDYQGQVLKTGQGNMELLKQRPGFYRARLLTPEGQTVEEVVELSPGEREEVRLAAPEPVDTNLAKELMANADFWVDSKDNTLDVSEKVGPIASATASTILALAANVININPPDWGHRLRKVGLRAFKDAVEKRTSSGLQILAAFESIPRKRIDKYLSEVKVRLWRFGEPLPVPFWRLVTSSGVSGLAELACGARPGPHWLSIQLPDQRPVIFGLSMLRQHLTMLVFHQKPNGQMRVFQYLPNLRATKKNDPNLLRRLELLERFYLNDRLDHAYPNAIELLKAKWREPIAWCLSGYLMLRLGRADELAKAVENMVNSFGELSDSHVLQAEYKANQGREEEAVAAFRAALDRGLPIFAEGLSRLFDAIQRYSIDHPSSELIKGIFNYRIRGLLWTAWSLPDEAGRSLGED